MATRGRKRKAGKRDRSGDLVRVRVDRGTPEALIHRARNCGLAPNRAVDLMLAGKADEAVKLVANDFAEAMDPLGCALIAGLIDHDGRDPQAMVLAGRHFRDLHNHMWGETCMATGSFEPRVRSSGYSETGFGKRKEDAFNKCTGLLKPLGRDVRNAFDDLCLSHFNPDWLDRLIQARTHDVAMRTGDWAKMQLALRGLAALC